MIAHTTYYVLLTAYWVGLGRGLKPVPHEPWRLARPSNTPATLYVRSGSLAALPILAAILKKSS